MEIFLSAFVTLFIVTDPIGVAAMYIALTPTLSEQARKVAALRGVLIASVMLYMFYFVGNKLLSILGIGVPAFRIAGGILFFLLAMDMIFARQSGLRSTTTGEQAEAEHKHDISVFPLAFPLIAGPGAMTTVLLMASESGSKMIYLFMVVIIAIVLLLTLISLLFASRISSILGETGSNVVSRLLGLILAALAVQYVMDGIKAGLLT